MAFFDYIKGMVTNSSQQTVEKGKQITEVTKLSSEIKSLENQRNTYYIQLGKLFYERFPDVTDSETEMVKRNIYEISVRMNQLQNQIQQLKGKIQCPGCGAMIDANAAFCSECGIRITFPQMNTPQKNRSCPRCRTPVEVGQVFCVQCGYRLTEIPQAQMDLEMEKQPEYNSSVPEMQSVKEKVCPKCGTPVEENQMFCVECGENLVNQIPVPDDRDNSKE